MFASAGCHGTGCPRPAPSTAYLHTERSERPAGGDWTWKKRVPGVWSAPTRPSQGRRSSAMSSAEEWMRNEGNVDAEAEMRGLGSGRDDIKYDFLEEDLEFDLDHLRGRDDADDDDDQGTFRFGELLDVNVDGLGWCASGESFQTFLRAVSKDDVSLLKKPLEPTAAVADAEASPSVLVPECPYAEKGCSRCRDKKAKGTGTGMSLFFMARDKDFSSKIDAGEKESLFLEGKRGSICFPKKSRDGAWDGCFCKFVKMILGVPIRNKNNNTYYDHSRSMETYVESVLTRMVR